MIRPAAVALLVVFVACSTHEAASGDDAGTDDFPNDAGGLDAPVGPVMCGVPVASTCATSAPCSFAAWQCPPAAACDGYFVVSDGAWTYFYSASDGSFAGEAPVVADGGVEACPYAFVVPTTCAPIVAATCGDAGAGADAVADADADADAD